MYCATNLVPTMFQAQSSSAIQRTRCWGLSTPNRVGFLSHTYRAQPYGRAFSLSATGATTAAATTRPTVAAEVEYQRNSATTHTCSMMKAASCVSGRRFGITRFTAPMVCATASSAGLSVLGWPEYTHSFHFFLFHGLGYPFIRGCAVYSLQ
jgi:hypothetical protein